MALYLELKQGKIPWNSDSMKAEGMCESVRTLQQTRPLITRMRRKQPKRIEPLLHSQVTHKTAREWQQTRDEQPHLKTKVILTAAKPNSSMLTKILRGGPPFCNFDIQLFFIRCSNYCFLTQDFCSQQLK